LKQTSFGKKQIIPHWHGFLQINAVSIHTKFCKKMIEIDMSLSRVGEYQNAAQLDIDRLGQ